MQLPTPVAVLCLALPAVCAMLPPGYEDELYCPRGACLRRRPTPPAFVGPRSAFWECYAAQGQNITAPHGWGFKLDPKIRQRLIEDGYTTELCPGVDPSGGVAAVGEATGGTASIFVEVAPAAAAVAVETEKVEEAAEGRALGNGHTCPRCSCPATRAAALATHAAYIPGCDAAMPQRFAARQCHAATARCWCAHAVTGLWVSDDFAGGCGGAPSAAAAGIVLAVTPAAGGVELQTTAAAPPASCREIRAAMHGSASPAGYTPTCSADGVGFAPRQCRSGVPAGAGDVCWCADAVTGLWEADDLAVCGGGPAGVAARVGAGADPRVGRVVSGVSRAQHLQHQAAAAAALTCAEVREATLAADIDGSYVPQCTPDGTQYLQRQCRGRLCWCADPTTGARTSVDLSTCLVPTTAGTAPSVTVHTVAAHGDIDATAAAPAAAGGDSTTAAFMLRGRTELFPQEQRQHVAGGAAGATTRGHHGGAGSGGHAAGGRSVEVTVNIDSGDHEQADMEVTVNIGGLRQGTHAAVATAVQASKAVLVAVGGGQGEGKTATAAAGAPAVPGPSTPPATGEQAFSWKTARALAGGAVIAFAVKVAASYWGLGSSRKAE